MDIRCLLFLAITFYAVVRKLLLDITDGRVGGIGEGFVRFVVWVAGEIKVVQGSVCGWGCTVVGRVMAGLGSGTVGSSVGFSPRVDIII